MVGGAVGYLHRVGRFWTSVGVAVTGVMHEGRVVLGEAGIELETIVVSWSGRANLGLVVTF
jgi:hypothetical protein